MYVSSVKVLKQSPIGFHYTCVWSESVVSPGKLSALVTDGIKQMWEIEVGMEIASVFPSAVFQVSLGSVLVVCIWHCWVIFLPKHPWIHSSVNCQVYQVCWNRELTELREINPSRTGPEEPVNPSDWFQLIGPKSMNELQLQSWNLSWGTESQ